ncbi:DUF6491 family protein [Brevundimonas sp. SORGH_AS_0993]|uniref:DUF6491 family protein n=1 Tax=Brevundimonas sp. SORGH_AS_0993 TaxID=3041794 RepID=UPI0027855EFE|nr:DUF6491 family protein [Brevundimonas sp. SORGH_AS_0993]MDQ1154164.1 hypothetical protein [Brevundimonas sp. SORGH_AS_0993]
MRLVPLALALAAVSAAGCAPVPPSGAGVARTDRATQCFRVEDIQNFRAASTTDLNIRTYRGQVFKISTGGGCWNLDNALALSVQPVLGASSFICVGDQVHVAVPNGMPGDGRCRGFVDKALTPEEVAALPKNARP